jgi:hypothetical protein
MNSRFGKYVVLLLLPACLALAGNTNADGLKASAGSDLVSRYNWRGLDFGDAFSVQPALKFEAGGWKAGFWGSYSSEFDEIDTWMSYTIATPNAGSFTGLVTDYYYPAAGIRYFNFNDYDDTTGPGAHLVELGLTWSGPAAFPITLSGYVNVYNEAGNCTYFQADYATKVQDVDLGFWIGATTGSKDNPVFYGSAERPVDDLQVINLGVKATRKLKLWEENELPLSVAFILNPQQEVSYLVLGISL